MKIYIGKFRLIVTRLPRSETRRTFPVVLVQSQFRLLAPSLKSIFMLNSAEHEIFNVDKYKNIKTFSFVKAQIKNI